MKTTKGKLRNITTGILHTDIGGVYTFLEEYLGEKGIMTHQLPSACRALEPILKTKLSEEWFTDEWIKEGLDEEIEVEDMTDFERGEFWADYKKKASEMWNKIKDKIIVVKT